LPSMYTQDELKNMFRVKGGGRKLKDQELEEKLLKYYNELKEELYPISTELLAYEFRARERWCNSFPRPEHIWQEATFISNL